MPNGKPGDTIFSDIVLHGTNVYSARVDELIRTIAALAPQDERHKLADLLEEKYNPAANPNVAELEKHLTALRVRLEGES